MEKTIKISYAKSSRGGWLAYNTNDSKIFRENSLTELTIAINNYYGIGKWKYVS